MPLTTLTPLMPLTTLTTLTPLTTLIKTYVSILASDALVQKELARTIPQPRKIVDGEIIFVQGKVTNPQHSMPM